MIRKVIALKKFKTTEEYYKYCMLKFFKKNPPNKDTFFPLKNKECNDLFSEPENQLGIAVKVTDIGYVLQCIYENKELFSVTDNDFYKAIDKLFAVKEFPVISL